MLDLSIRASMKSDTQAVSAVVTTPLQVMDYHYTNRFVTVLILVTTVGIEPRTVRIQAVY